MPVIIGSNVDTHHGVAAPSQLVDGDWLNFIEFLVSLSSVKVLHMQKSSILKMHSVILASVLYIMVLMWLNSMHTKGKNNTKQLHFNWGISFRHLFCYCCKCSKEVNKFTIAIRSTSQYIPRVWYSHPIMHCFQWDVVQ